MTKSVCRLTIDPACFCQMYKHSNNKMMTSGAIAAMLSTILYGRRFFPYYVYNIIGGLDEHGMNRSIMYLECSSMQFKLILYPPVCIHYFLVLVLKT